MRENQKLATDYLKNKVVPEHAEKMKHDTIKRFTTGQNAPALAEATLIFKYLERVGGGGSSPVGAAHPRFRQR